MTAGDRELTKTSSVFEVIAPFTFSLDPHLRGNAVYALAALVRSPDPAVSATARKELVELLIAEPGGTREWQRRFARRALDALRSVAPRERQSIAEAALNRVAELRDPARQAAISLLLAGMEPDRRLWLLPLGWMSAMQLATFAGRPGTLHSLGAAAWRSLVGWPVLGSVLFAIPALIPWFSLSSGVTEQGIQMFALMSALGCIVLAILTRLSLSGRVETLMLARVLDVVLCGIFVMILTGVAIGVVEREVKQPLTEALLGAFAIGVMVRSMRWATDGAELAPQGMASVLRPLIAFLATTLICAIGAWGVDARSAGLVWMVLAPAAAIVASLDRWLETREPMPVLPGKRVERTWVLPSLAGALFVACAALVAFNVGNALLLVGGERIAADNVYALPSASTANPSRTFEIELGRRIGIDLQRDAEIAVITDWPKEVTAAGDVPPPWRNMFRSNDTVLIIKEAGASRFSQSVDDPEPPAFLGRMAKGRYYACVMLVEILPPSDCGVVVHLDVVDVAALLLSGRLSTPGISRKVAVCVKPPAVSASAGGTSPAGPSSIAGTWRGQYSYDNTDRPPVKFDLELWACDARLAGTISEFAAMDGKPERALRANVTGRMDGSVLTFRKTYDGTGGVNHSVDYEGTWDPAARRIGGTWRIGNQTRGTFEATAAP